MTCGAKHINDLEYKWLKENGAATKQQLNEKWMEYFDSLGVPSGSYNDRWDNYLDILGYEGVVTEKRKAFYCGVTPAVASAFLLVETGGFLLTEAGARIIL